jgi:hypothetical protein
MKEKGEQITLDLQYPIEMLCKQQMQATCIF